MSKIPLYLLALSATLLVIVYSVGTRRGPEINATFRFTLPESIDFIFAIYSDVSRFPDRKRNLETVEILEATPTQVFRWKEIYKNGNIKEYELIRFSRPNNFDFIVRNFSNNKESEVTVTFSVVGEATEIIMTESTEINNRFLRGVRFFMGDDWFLRGEAKWLRVAILQDQLRRN